MKIFSSSFPILVCIALLMSACAPVAGVSPTGTPAVVPTSQEQGLEMKLDEYLTRLTALGFRGSVLIAHDGNVVLSKGYGALDDNASDLITPETLFAIGSNTKPFTAAAILKLQDQGSLNVKDPISYFFADVPSDKSAITIHQLLTHSSGLDHSGVFHGDFERVSRDDAVARILKANSCFHRAKRHPTRITDSFCWQRLSKWLRVHRIRTICGRKSLNPPK
jgi:CubicO group peptidase (beta-lactamase class C family)